MVTPKKSAILAAYSRSGVLEPERYLEMVVRGISDCSENLVRLYPFEIIRVFRFFRKVS